MRAVTPILVLFAATACGKGAAPAALPAPARSVAPARILLRYHPRAGLRYSVVTSQDTHTEPDSGGMAIPTSALTLRTYSRDSVLTPAGDTVRIRQVIDSIASGDSGVASLLAARLAEARGTTGTLTLDGRMNVLQTVFTDRSGNSTELSAAMAENARHYALPLPSIPVAPGDTWSTSIDAGFSRMIPGLSDSVAMTAVMRLDSILVAGADTSVWLAVRLTFPAAPFSMSTGGMQMSIRMSGAVAGQELFSVTRGIMMGSMLDGTIHLSASSPVLQGAVIRARVTQHVARAVVTP